MYYNDKESNIFLVAFLYTYSSLPLTLSFNLFNVVFLNEL